MTEDQNTQDAITPRSAMATEAMAEGITESLQDYVEMKMLAALAVTIQTYPKGEAREATIQTKFQNIAGLSLDATLPEAIEIIYAESGTKDKEAKMPQAFEPCLAFGAIQSAAERLEQFLRQDEYDGVDVIVTDYAAGTSKVAKLEVLGLNPVAAEAFGLPLMVKLVTSPVGFE